MVKKRSNWYTRYLNERFYDRCRYDVNRARFIMVLLSFGALPCEIFTLAYENNLRVHVEIRFDARIVKGASLLVEHYPPYIDWFRALREYYPFVTREVFDKPYFLKGSFVEDEPFWTVWNQWDSTLSNMLRYIKQHEAIYGKKDMWKKPIYR